MNWLDGGKSCLMLGRMNRRNEAAWQTTRSCLGGLPPLSVDDWPRGKEGPMHCVAQIDCAEVGAVLGAKGLPRTGILAFFADISDVGMIGPGAVRHLPDGAVADRLPDEFFSPVFGGSEPCWMNNLAKVGLPVPRHFPRWPVQMVRARQTRTREGLAFTPSLENILGPVADSVHLDMTGFAKTTTQAFQKKSNPGNGDAPTTKTQVYTRNQLDVEPHHPRVAAALLGEMRLGLASMRSALANVERQIDKAADAVASGAADQLGADSGAAFLHAYSNASTALNARHQSVFGHGTSASADAAKTVYFQMYSGSRADYEAIPAPMRDQIERLCLRSAYPSASPHQMFGIADDIQGQLDERGTTLLLQLGYDEAMSFCWGDVGVLQFSIPNSDLLAGNWGAATMLMQGH